ncbi:hypothetical protein SASPL_114837 [Salvia splendens]|uniref:NADPH oxidase Respiratory burst domain-containing protein n=1 Tax=Salvia splendens TaxID=180675 RepID=A0A8X8Y4G2_SALSN|nr:hypothetical protein SASPL_114837 [Salvia splendens]
MQSKCMTCVGCDSQPAKIFGRTKSATAQALTGLKFITKTGGAATWTDVETRFYRLTPLTNGLLPRALFGECIGVKESSQFDGELFDVLARKRNISGECINEAQLNDFWVQLVDPKNLEMVLLRGTEQSDGEESRNLSKMMSEKLMQREEKAYKKEAAFEVMGHCVCAAKGAVETLKANMALILLPMCRNTITWLRNRTSLGAALPFDDNINFHMVTL